MLIIVPKNILKSSEAKKIVYAGEAAYTIIILSLCTELSVFKALQLHYHSNPFSRLVIVSYYSHTAERGLLLRDWLTRAPELVAKI